MNWRVDLSTTAEAAEAFGGLQIKCEAVLAG